MRTTTIVSSLTRRASVGAPDASSAHIHLIADGLAASVFTQHVDRGYALAREIDSGVSCAFLLYRDKLWVWEGVY